MSLGQVVPLVIASAMAIAILTRLMLSRRNKLTTQLHAEAVAETKRRKTAELAERRSKARRS